MPGIWPSQAVWSMDTLESARLCESEIAAARTYPMSVRPVLDKARTDWSRRAPLGVSARHASVDGPFVLPELLMSGGSGPQDDLPGGGRRGRGEPVLIVMRPPRVEKGAEGTREDWVRKDGCGGTDITSDTQDDNARPILRGCTPNRVSELVGDAITSRTKPCEYSCEKRSVSARHQLRRSLY